MIKSTYYDGILCIEWLSAWSLCPLSLFSSHMCFVSSTCVCGSSYRITVCLLESNVSYFMLIVSRSVIWLQFPSLAHVPISFDPLLRALMHAGIGWVPERVRLSYWTLLVWIMPCNTGCKETYIAGGTQTHIESHVTLTSRWYICEKMSPLTALNDNDSAGHYCTFTDTDSLPYITQSLMQCVFHITVLRFSGEMCWISIEIIS